MVFYVCSFPRLKKELLLKILTCYTLTYTLHCNIDLYLSLSRLLLEGAPLIAIHKARYFKKQEGLCLGPGKSSH